MKVIKNREVLFAGIYSLDLDAQIIQDMPADIWQIEYQKAEEVRKSHLDRITHIFEHIEGDIVELKVLADEVDKAYKELLMNKL